jgi:hypothetical protein
MRPSKEAQDLYFRKNTLDPWGYDNPSIQTRLDESLRFIQRFLTRDFAGTFVEIGAFNGDFTRRLLKAFPRARVLASDLVKAPWEAAAARENFPPSVSFQWCDMMDFRMPEASDKPVILLLMECLYYLPAESRPEALATLASASFAEMTFVSGPLDSGDFYLSETHIAGLFKTCWPNGLGSKTVMPVGLVPTLRQIYGRLLGKPGIRRQVIFGFRKTIAFVFMSGIELAPDIVELVQEISLAAAA